MLQETKQLLHPECYRCKGVIFMLRHQVRACVLKICCFQLSLVIVFEPKHGHMEHTTILSTQVVVFVVYHTLKEAKFAASHVGERGPDVPLPVLAEQLILQLLPIQLH